MAHHIFDFQDRALRMHDADVVLVKHFLELGAKQLGHEALFTSLSQWEWSGPGVWINVDEAALASHPEVFAAAENASAEFGAIVPAQYLRANVPSLGCASDRSAELIRNELQKLRALVRPGA